MTEAHWEGVKEVLRWTVLMAVSWVFTEMLAQIGSVPESYKLNLWVFSFMLPVRLTLQMVLTFALRYIDKVKFTNSKIDSTYKAGVSPKGLLPF